MKMPRKMRRAALRSALSAKASDQEIICVDALRVKEPKSREVAEVLQKLVGESSVLVLVADRSEENEKFRRSARNLPHVKTLNANYLNIRDLLSYDKILLPLNCLDVITGYLG